MYALVEILGKQYKAVEGETLQVDKLSMEENAPYEIEKVLAVVTDNDAKFGTPYVEGAKVSATVKGDVKGDKIKVYKFHKRKGYRRTQGHREQYSLITINKIEA
ncbi:MAG: 50S ribosomal protein L21 [Spirochaetales bacterium]|nr:50S ribosomal protein L21 [Spirochaetales bacterium]